MPVPAITVDNLSKRYLLGHTSPNNRISNYTALRDVISREATTLGRNLVNFVRGQPTAQSGEVEEFWALRDVHFEVNEGDALGIIGRNGAGKSTLLKILSRITEPTSGRIRLRGHVASLLEVGAGFHPELTGRENIFLNGAILGMTRADIRKRFDEIVAFAEIERFLDTPVKRYSSGMYVRLAFAVAAHLEPEILIVDEVLAVGDFEFQKKCLGKMEEVSRGEGRTVLFVSHNMPAIADLTNKALLLQAGEVIMAGDTPDVVTAYLSAASRAAQSVYVSPKGEGYDQPHIARAEIASGIQHGGEPLQIKVWVRHTTPLPRACLGGQILNQFQVSALILHAYPPEVQFGAEPGLTLIEFFVPRLRLHRGRFRLRLWLTQTQPGEVNEIVEDACAFEVARLDDHPVMRQWPPDACVYHDEFSVRLTRERAELWT